MKTFKKILSLLLALALCLSLGIYTVSAADPDKENVSDIELLNMLGIFQGYEDGNLHPDWSITRMQYAALIMRVLGYDTGIGQMETGFSDVPMDSWGSGYVKMAYDLGIISGYGDGTFRPENPVTQAESVKMLVAALGYSIAAERNGGFPQGYIAMASRLELLENAVATTVQATRGYVATLLVNGLEARFLETQYDTDTMYVSGETILDRMNISLREGVLTAVYGSSLNKGENLKQDEVMVSGELFKTKLNISADFVGSKVKIYVQNYGRDDELLVGITGSYSGKTMSVEAPFILDGTNLSNFVYKDENGKNRSVGLEPNIKITYNGKVIDNSLDYTDDKLKPESGYVKLMDTDGDSVYDTAIVKDYETLVVRSVTDKAIYGEFGNSIRYEDKDTVVTVIYNDMFCSLSDIKAGDVLSGAVSLDGSVVEIIICRDIAEGIVSAQQDNEDDIIYILDNGEALLAAPEYAAALAGGYNMAEEIKLGSDMKFSLNYFGEIAAAVINTEGRSEGEYAYIVAMGKGGSAISNVYEIKLLTKDNRYEIFETAANGKVKFGRMVETGRDASGKLLKEYRVDNVSPADIFNTVYFEGIYIQRSMAMYKLNSDGAIKEFYLRDETGDKTYFSYDVPRGSKIVSNRLIEGKYYWDDDTVLFHIPKGGLYITSLSAGKVDDYFNSGSYILELYDVEENGYVNCIYYHDSTTGRPLDAGGSRDRIDYVNSPIMYVTRMYNEIGDDGIDYCILEGWENKTKVRRLMSDTLSKKASDIRPGSVIQYATNEKDKLFANSIENDITIVTYAKLFDCNASGILTFSV